MGHSSDLGDGENHFPDDPDTIKKKKKKEREKKERNQAPRASSGLH